MAALAVALAGMAAAAEPSPVPRPEIRAQITAKRATILSAEIAARIERLPFREGDRFRQGDLLMGLDCSFQRAQADEARSMLAAADKTQSVSRRLLELGSGGQLEAEVASAEAAKAQARLQSSNVILSKCSVAAPFPGRVVEQKVHEFQYVQAGQPVMEILDDSTLETEFIAPSVWLAWLKPGVALQIRVDETGGTYPLKVARVGAKIDAVSHSVKVVASLVGGCPDLIVGMSGRIIVPPPG